MDKNRAFELLGKIGFTRVGGSAEELLCAEMLLDEIKSAGGDGHIEPFQVNRQTITKQTLTADNVEYPVVGYGNSGSTSAEGLTAPFYYMELCKDNEVDKFKAQGCIVLVNGYLGKEAYKAVVDSGAVGFITFGGTILDKIEDSDLMLRELRQPLKDIKVLPGVNIRASDALNLVKQNPNYVTINLQQEEGMCDSRNVVAYIKGDIAETVVFTAHYDSVHYSKGVYDNGAGSVILMELYRYFLANKPRRNLVFVWCGSEERGLLGSKAYVAQHQDQLEEIVFCVNVDVAAPVLGVESAICIGESNLASIVDYMAKEIGHVLKVSTDIYSSDCIPFADKGIPAINFMRFGPAGTAYLHDRNDTMAFLSADALAKTGEFAEHFCKRIVNCVAFPIKKTIPKDLVEKVDKYLGKDIK
ncbi:MAG: M28 family metallopeptidase [Clostridia bacterium]|nr:M28 family metallopeptidase [Clostridia bacterium]MDD3832098.1 M28 family metallopeptidase [Clostridia bacterium]